MANFRNLRVWQKSRELSIATVRAMEGVRGDAGRILRLQLFRSTFSVQANIAEGSSKKSDREFARYVRIALGSSTEAANHLILLSDLELIGRNAFLALEAKQDAVGKMLSGLEKRLSRSNAVTRRRPARIANSE